ncbi:DUF1116 domain-containing protein [Candidatus Dependentiae bacterium]|nr:DUF1116 domain-containing protein [Candidatus Dependentiae bacterium]
MSSQLFLIDVKPAKDVIPDFKGKMILHSGPPITWERMCGPTKGAIMGACVYEGWAQTVEEAEKMCASGKIKFDPCHHHNTVGPMAGIVSPSMWVWCIKNTVHKNTAYCTLNEGLGKVLRFGAYGEDVIKRLKWMETVLAPLLEKAVKISVEKNGGINIKSLMSQVLMMGDECHNRNVAGTSLFIKEIIPYLLQTDADKEIIKDAIDFMSGNVHFFLNLTMPAQKAAADTIKGIKYCSIVYGMARNGTDTGIRISGLGEEWFTAQSGMPKGLYFAGYSEDDANPDLGDSTITETAGVGANAMASAPAIVKFVGGVPADALLATKEMFLITHAKHRDFQIPQLNFEGTPVGFDILKIMETGILPFINTGIAHKKAGIGQIGAGILRAPMSCFKQAFKKFAETYLK